IVRIERAGSGQDCNLLSCIQNIRRQTQIRLIGDLGAGSENVRSMMRPVSLRGVLSCYFFFLQVHRKSNMRDRSIANGRTAGLVREVLDVARPHDTLIKDSDIFEELVKRYVLL